ncbi:MAG: acyl-CoA synthetase [Mycobacterium sp.]|nr:acyl-CoA synthetase [Mycobacterium sp.]
MAPTFELPVGQDVKSSGSYTALTPLAFLERSLDVFADKTAIAYGDRRLSYSEFGAVANPSGECSWRFWH